MSARRVSPPASLPAKPPSAHACTAALAELVYLLRTIQFSRGDHPWLLLDLTMLQLKAVLTLAQSGGMRSRELADGLRIAPSAATPLVDRLIDQQLARREDDASDRRIIWIRPTARAVEINKQLMQTNRRVLAEVFTGLAPEQRAQVQESVTLLVGIAARVLGEEREIPKPTSQIPHPKRRAAKLKAR